MFQKKKLKERSIHVNVALRWHFANIEKVPDVLDVVVEHDALKLMSWMWLLSMMHLN